MPAAIGVVAGIAGAIGSAAGAVGGAITAGLGAIGITGAAATFVEGTTLSLGASFAMSEISKALAPGPALPTSIMQAAAPRQFVYGQMRVGGVFAYVGTSGGGKYLNMVIIWAAHSVQSIDSIYLDGRKVYLSGNTDDGNDHQDDSGNTYNFHGKVSIWHSLGGVPGTQFSALTAQDPNWDSTCTLDGIACSYIRCEFDSSIFPHEPAVVAVIHGKNDIYDPRMNAGAGGTGYTDNAALCIADAFLNAEYGLACDQSEIDMDQLTAAANLCDEQVALAAGGTESRYTVNGFFNTESEPGDIISAMTMACEGRYTWTGGQWKIYPAAWYGSDLAFDEGDIVGQPVKWLPVRKYRDKANAVRATYISPKYPYAVVGYDRDHKDPNIFSAQWQSADAPEYAQDTLHGYVSDANLAADGTRLYQTRGYRFVTSVATAQRLMKIYLLRNRQQGSGVLKMALSAYQCVAQDNIQMSFPALGWDNKYFEVQQMRFVAGESQGSEDDNADEQPPPALQVELTVAETDPSVYEWSTTEERGPENTTSPAIANSRIVETPTGLVLASGSGTAVQGADGVVIPRIQATWNELTDPFTLSGGAVELQWQKVGDGEWKSAGFFAPTTTKYFLTGVVSGQTYNVRLRAIRANGAWSGSWDESDNHTVSATFSSISVGHITGLGTFATMSSIDFASGPITNKNLGNLPDGNGWFKVTGVTSQNQTSTDSYQANSVTASAYIQDFTTTYNIAPGTTGIVAPLISLAIPATGGVFLISASLNWEIQNNVNDQAKIQILIDGAVNNETVLYANALYGAPTGNTPRGIGIVCAYTTAPMTPGAHNIFLQFDANGAQNWLVFNTKFSATVLKV